MSKWKWTGGGIIRVGVGNVVEVGPGEVVEFDDKISRDLRIGGDPEWQELVEPTPVIEAVIEPVEAPPQEVEIHRRKPVKIYENAEDIKDEN